MPWHTLVHVSQFYTWLYIAVGTSHLSSAYFGTEPKCLLRPGSSRAAQICRTRSLKRIIVLEKNKKQKRQKLVMEYI